jgi:hypothetical protein
MLLKFLRDWPGPAQVAAGVCSAGLLLSALVLGGPMNIHRRTAVKQTPHECATVACHTPSPRESVPPS